MLRQRPRLDAPGVLKARATPVGLRKKTRLAKMLDGNPLMKVATNPSWLLVVALRDAAARARVKAVIEKRWTPEIGALGAARLLGSLRARRFTRSLRRLTEASRGIAEGDLGARVPVGLGGAVEIEALSRQFNRMAAQLEESVEFIRRDRDRSRDFLADVSHELRTPMTTIYGASELLFRSKSLAEDDRTGLISDIHAEAVRMEGIVENLLFLSRAQRGTLEAAHEPVHLGRILPRIVEAEASRWPEVQFRLELPEEVPVAAGDDTYTSEIETERDFVTGINNCTGSTTKADVDTLTYKLTSSGASIAGSTSKTVTFTIKAA